MTKTCEICGKQYEPRPGTESWSRNCYECYKAGRVPKTKAQIADEKLDRILKGTLMIYDRLDDISRTQIEEKKKFLEHIQSGKPIHLTEPLDTGQLSDLDQEMRAEQKAIEHEPPEETMGEPTTGGATPIEDTNPPGTDEYGNVPPDVEPF